MGVYLGMSMQHARGVALVLNLKTGHVSPQFHITLDLKFETVRQSLGNLSPPSEWQKMCGIKASSPSRHQGIKQPTQAQGIQHGVPFMEFDLEPGEAVNEGEAQASQTPIPVSEGEQDQEPQVQLRRSPRLNKTPEVSTTKVTNEHSSGPGSKVFDVWYNFEAKLEDKLPYHVAYETIKEWGGIEGEQHPMLAYAASADPDTMFYHGAMREPDCAKFVKAMQKEVQSHTEKGVWKLVPRSSVTPGIKSLPAVWAMRRKRRIATREVLPLMELVQEMRDHGCGLTATTPRLHCRGFEDNSSAIELPSSVKDPKMRPRTRHINIKYHHLRNKVLDGTISIHPVSTEDMLADILTKICNEETHTKLQKQMMGW